MREEKLLKKKEGKSAKWPQEQKDKKGSKPQHVKNRSKPLLMVQQVSKPNPNINPQAHCKSQERGSLVEFGDLGVPQCCLLCVSPLSRLPPPSKYRGRIESTFFCSLLRLSVGVRPLAVGSCFVFAWFWCSCCAGAAKTQVSR